MFDATRREVAARIGEGRRLLATAAKATVAAATCRGLLFVELYGTYEYAVTRAVQAALDTIRRESLNYGEIRRSVLAIVLDAQFDSAAKSGRDRLWEQRIALLSAIDDDGQVAELRDSVFPNDGSHYRAQQLTTVWQVLGIASPVVPDRKFLGRINELVDNRNAIAHGRRTAHEVGARYSIAEMEKRVSDTEAITYHVIDTVKAHCMAGGLKSV